MYKRQIQSEQPNVLGIVLHENTWRHYRGKKRTYMAEVKLKGDEAETVTVGLAEFKNITDGMPLKTGRSRINLASWPRPRFDAPNRSKWPAILGCGRSQNSSDWSG